MPEFKKRNIKYYVSKAAIIQCNLCDGVDNGYWSIFKYYNVRFSAL